jgi:glycosyltransferase involved in cell wall biosynthesis
LRIAFYCPNKSLDDPHPSGDLVIARGLLQALNGLGHDCRELIAFRARWFWKSPQGWWRAVSSLIRAWRLARSWRPQVWLSYHSYYKSPDVLGPWICSALNIPYVLFQPIYSTRPRRDPATRLGFYLNRQALRSAQHAFTNNINDIQALRRILRESQITYVPPGIFPEEFRRDAEAGRRLRQSLRIPEHVALLLTAARFRPGVKLQSLAYLFRSLHLLAAKDLPFQLLVVGDGPMEGQVRSMAERLVPGRVRFAGRVMREHMVRYYSAADLFVFPGIGESLGMVYLEAQACGLPVVALDTAGVPQVVQRDETALLVRKDDGGALADAVETLLFEPETRRRLAANGPPFICQRRNLHHNYGLLAESLEMLGR